jgi:hypothetical protein
MGGIVGGLVGAAGQYLGAKQQASAAKDAAKAAQQGFKYLTTGKGGAAEQQFIDAGVGASKGQQTTQEMQGQLLGSSPITADTQNGFNNYLNSTAYKFQLGQGQDAIGSDAAAKGLLNSGGTAKALTQYGQNLAGTTFNNYLGQLGNLNNEQGATATQGQQSLGQIGTTGTAAGQGAANAMISGGNAAASGTVAAFNGIGNALGSVGGLGNVFGSSGGQPAGNSQYMTAQNGGVGLY